MRRPSIAWFQELWRRRCTTGRNRGTRPTRRRRSWSSRPSRLVLPAAEGIRAAPCRGWPSPRLKVKRRWPTTERKTRNAAAGTTNWTSCSPASAFPLALATCGDSRICVTKTEEVSVGRFFCKTQMSNVRACWIYFLLIFMIFVMFISVEIWGNSF